MMRVVNSMVSWISVIGVWVVQLADQGWVKRMYFFPEGSSLHVTPLGKRAVASASEREGMTITLSPGWKQKVEERFDLHNNNYNLKIDSSFRQDKIIQTIYNHIFFVLMKCSTY